MITETIVDFRISRIDNNGQIVEVSPKNFGELQSVKHPRQPKIDEREIETGPCLDELKGFVGCSRPSRTVIELSCPRKTVPNLA